MKYFQWLAVVGLTALVAGCGDSNKSTNNPTVQKGKLSGIEYVVLTGDLLKRDASSLSGAGSVVFLEARPDANSNYTLKFSLPENGALALTSNADKKLAKGTTIQFARAGKRLKVTASVGSETFDFDSKYATELARVDASRPLQVSVDVHEHGDVILEVGGAEMEGEFNARPTGRFWGLTLSNAMVTAVTPDKQHHNH